MTKSTKNWHDKLKQSVLDDPGSRFEYESFKIQLELSDKMSKLREKAQVTQEEIAEKMHTTKSTIARLEAAGGRGKHSPSLKTLSKYANALGYSLDIKLRRG